MADVSCAGGSVLTVRPVPVLARDGVPYEVLLELLLDGEPFGQVGERCGFFLADAARRLHDTPLVSTLEVGTRGWARGGGLDEQAVWGGLARHLPRDRELFAFRARDPDDGPGGGALRALLDVARAWRAGAWSTEVQVRIEAWGDDGRGVLAVLDLPAARTLLDAIVAEVVGLGGPPVVTL